MVQSVPIDIKITISNIDGIENSAKTKDEWVVSKIPIGSYKIRYMYNQKVVEKTIEIKENEATKVFVNLLSEEHKVSHASMNINLHWASIPGGSFNMGSPVGEDNYRSAEVRHEVTVSSFKMSQYEITFEPYDIFCDATGRAKPNDNGFGRGNRPVINVSWYDAKAFVDHVCCRLPTEAEWEYACRAGSSTPFNTGNNLTTTDANYDGNYPYLTNAKGTFKQMTLPVGSYPKNAYGLYDMHGNVGEWCSDWNGPYITSPQTNPQGPSSGTLRVYRGGAWTRNAGACRSAYRDSFGPDRTDKSIGFRVVALK